MGDINEQYPVTNCMWKYVNDMTMGEYLASLGVDARRYGFIKGYPKSFYLRVGIYNVGYKIEYDWDTGLNEIEKRKMVELRNSDPWYRKFKVFPIGNNVFGFGNDVYNYFPLMATGLSNYSSGIYNCYVIVTTVNGKIVYCVDRINI